MTKTQGSKIGSMDNFLSSEDRRRIRETVQAMERATAGEIVPCVAPASYHYPVGAIIGAASLALPTALLGAHFLGGFFWLGQDNLWLFLGLLSIVFWPWYLVVRRVPVLHRLFISEHEMAEEVREAAFVNFYKNGLHFTRDHTGVLIFISAFERQVIILADKGINDKVPRDRWDAIVKNLTMGIRAKQSAAAICRAVETVGRLLAEHFPPRSDDVDELQNLVVDP